MKGRTGSIGLLAMICVVGCGGGHQGSLSSAAQHTASAGQAVITYFGQPKPMTTTSNSTVTVLSQAGATFSTVTLEPAPNLADTSLVFSRRASGTDELFTLPYGSSTAQVLYQTPLGATFPAVSSYGTIMFDTLNASNTNTGQTESIRADGSGLATVTFSDGAAVEPAFSHDGTNRVAFFTLNGLWVAPGTGGTASKAQESINSPGVSWNPAGTQIAYSAFYAGPGNSDVFVTSPSGGSPTDVTPTALRDTGFFVAPAWSPDGATIAVSYAPTGASSYETLKFSASDPGGYQVITPSGYADSAVTYSPDGSKMAFYRSNAGEAQPGLYIADSTGYNQALVLPDAPGGQNGVDSCDWSPFLPKETVVAAAGSTFYHQAASGFLLSENGTRFGSLVAFTAATPSSAVISAPATGSGTAPLVFTITADAIAQIGYIDNYFSPGTTISLTSTPTVVVSVDGVTGQVNLVAPAALPATSRASGPTVIYSGKFKALYDGNGKNLAPSGASELTVDPKSGKLISFR